MARRCARSTSSSSARSPTTRSCDCSSPCSSGPSAGTRHVSSATRAARGAALAARALLAVAARTARGSFRAEPAGRPCSRARWRARRAAGARAAAERAASRDEEEGTAARAEAARTTAEQRAERRRRRRWPRGDASPAQQLRCCASSAAAWRDAHASCLALIVLSNQLQGQVMISCLASVSLLVPGYVARLVPRRWRFSNRSRTRGPPPRTIPPCSRHAALNCRSTTPSSRRRLLSLRWLEAAHERWWAGCGIGCDHSKLIAALCSRTKSQLRDTAKAYVELYGKELRETVKKNAAPTLRQAALLHPWRSRRHPTCTSRTSSISRAVAWAAITTRSSSCSSADPTTRWRGANGSGRPQGQVAHRLSRRRARSLVPRSQRAHPEGDRGRSRRWRRRRR